MAYEQECYQDFAYVILDKWFHAFEAEDHICGLAFADDFDAARFHGKVKSLVQLAHKIPAGTVAPQPAKPEVKTTLKAPDRAKKPKSSGGITGWLFKKKETPQKGRPTKLNISGPRNFVHVSHIGFNAKEGFKAENIPPEWRTLFQKAGIKDEELSDPKTAKFM